MLRVVVVGLAGVAFVACGGSQAGWAATQVRIALERADAPDQALSAVETGSTAPYSRYRGPVTTWASGLSIDGRHPFDRLDGQQRIVARSTVLELDLDDGEHVVEPLGLKFRVLNGRAESLSPQAIATADGLSLRLFPVTFVTRNAAQPGPAVRLHLATPRGPLFSTAPGTFPEVLTVYLPATASGYATNLSRSLLQVDERGVRWVAADDKSADDKSAVEDAPQIDGSNVVLPCWHVTAVLLLDRPADKLAAQLSAREESTQGADLEARLGNWDPRNRLTAHAALTMSRAGWAFETGLHSWRVEAADQASFGHQAFVVDRPQFSAPGGEQRERALQILLATDRISPGRGLPVRWRWLGHKGLPPVAGQQLVALVQQAPTLANDAVGWRSVDVAPQEASTDQGTATLTFPPQLAPGRAWLRVGIADQAGSKPTDRWLAEIPITMAPEKPSAPATELSQPVAPAAENLVFGGDRPAASRVPEAWRQGTFLTPQCVSAVDISEDEHCVGVSTLAFRDDHNFWLLSDSGQVMSSRHVDPWAPQQVAVLAEGKTCAVGLAYSRFTDPSPTLAVFGADAAAETTLVDAFWDLGWLRYGAGDWRTGWPASIVGDLFARGGNQLSTICSQDGARRFTSDGEAHSYPLAYQRPFRMTASSDGHVLACGYLTPDVSGLDEPNRSRLRSPPAYLSVRNTLTSAQIWSRRADTDPGLAVPAPPEAAADFPELAAEFRSQPLALLPLRVPYSLALSGDGSILAATEYGGHLRLKQQRGIGTWNPDHPVSYCPRQRGRLRVCNGQGAELARMALPAEGLFDVHLDRQGQAAWLCPSNWFSRGLAGRSWLPADPEARNIHIVDVAHRAWRRHVQLPDAVSDLALHPDGERALISCWDGKLYLIGPDGKQLAMLDAGDAARVRWSATGRFAVAGTQSGNVLAIGSDGALLWRIALPTAAAPASSEPLRPVIADLPIYAVGRTGPEHAYVGDIWLIKTDQGAIQVDCGGTSAVPATWRQMRAAGVDPSQPRPLLLSHSHGDHAGAAYLWRAQGAQIVAPETAALTVGWLMPTWTDYGLWVPTQVDRPLPLKRIGDETEFTLAGLKMRAIFAPGHSFDSVVYLFELAGKRVAFTGDIGFEGDSHILHRCWGDPQAAQGVLNVFRKQVLPFRPDHVFTGHTVYRDGVKFLDSLVERTEAALRAR